MMRRWGMLLSRKPVAAAVVVVVLLLAAVSWLGARKVDQDDDLLAFLPQSNPTVAALEGAEAGYCTASGLGAISATLLQLCAKDDHIVASNTIYGGTFALLKDYLPDRTGIRTTFVDANDTPVQNHAKYWNIYLLGIN